MNIRDKLLTLFSIIVVTILIIFTTWIFIFSSQYRKTDYYNRLEDKANTYAQLLFNVAIVDEPLMQIIKQNSPALFQEECYIISGDNKIIYFSSLETNPNVDTTLINQIRIEKRVEFNSKKRDGLGMLYEFENMDFIVVISAYDKYGFAKINNLELGLIIGLIISVFATVVIGRFYVRKTLSPISNVIKQVNEISVTNLNRRVDEGNKKDELAQLAITFNNMLQRIEEAFLLQRDFVSYAAHELRTPVTVMLAEIDFALNKERDKNYYKKVLSDLSNDIKKLSQLSNGLLDLARLSFDKTTFNLNPVRIDECLVEVCNTVLTENKDFKVMLNFKSFPENDDQLSVFGNDQLLTIAFKNIIENGLKFSDLKTVKIELESENDNPSIKFTDQGIGIPADDVENIFQPFFRGKNANSFSGFGIGLALTSKIIELHNGKISVDSTLKKGSVFTVVLPNRNNF